MSTFQSELENARKALALAEQIAAILPDWMLNKATPLHSGPVYVNLPYDLSLIARVEEELASCGLKKISEHLNVFQAILWMDFKHPSFPPHRFGREHVEIAFRGMDSAATCQVQVKTLVEEVCPLYEIVCQEA